MKKLFALASFFLLAVTAITNAHAITRNTATTDAQKNAEVASEVIAIQSPTLKLANAHTAMGFMDMENHGAQSHILIAAYSPAAIETVLHKSIEKNGQSVMRRINHILIPAKKATDLKFGGLHIMLIGLRNSPDINTAVPITLLFDDGSAEVIQAKVVS